MTNLVAGFFTPWAVLALIGVLHLALPARRVTGYVHDERSGELLRYRLNGLLVLVVTLGIWIAVCAGGVMPWDWVWLPERSQTVSAVCCAAASGVCHVTSTTSARLPWRPV